MIATIPTAGCVVRRCPARDASSAVLGMNPLSGPCRPSSPFRGTRTRTVICAATETVSIQLCESCETSVLIVPCLPTAMDHPHPTRYRRFQSDCWSTAYMFANQQELRAYLVIFSSSRSRGSTARLFSYISCTSAAACMLLRM